MVPQTNPQPTSASVNMLVLVLAASLAIKLPVHGLGKQQRMGQVPRILHSRGRPKINSLLQMGSALALTAVWGVNQQLEDYVSLLKKENKIIEKENKQYRDLNCNQISTINTMYAHRFCVVATF